MTDETIERVARIIDPIAWFHLDKGTDTKATPGKRSRSTRIARDIVHKIPHLRLAGEIEELLTGAEQALKGVIALDEEDEGPDGESHTCSFIAAKISNLRAALAKGRSK